MNCTSWSYRFCTKSKQKVNLLDTRSLRSQDCRTSALLWNAVCAQESRSGSSNLSLFNSLEAMAAMVESQSESINQLPINQLESHLKKVKDHVDFLEDKLTLLKTAVGQERPDDVAIVLSQESLDTARKFQDLKPATCPPGSDRLEDLKSEAESGQEQCVQKATEAKETLADLGTKATNIGAAGLALTMEDHRSSELAKMEDVTGKVAAVSGDHHQVRSVDEVLEAEGISTSLSKTSKMEKYEEVKSKREEDYLDTLLEVFDGPVALPMHFDEIIAVQDETQAELSEIGEKAGQGRVEVRNIHENLETHLDARLQQSVLTGFDGCPRSIARLIVVFNHGNLFAELCILNPGVCEEAGNHLQKVEKERIGEVADKPCRG